MKLLLVFRVINTTRNSLIEHHQLSMPPIRGRRCALTDLQKGQISRARGLSENTPLKLDEFGELFKDLPGAHGRSIPRSTMCDILKDKNH